MANRAELSSTAAQPSAENRAVTATREARQVGPDCDALSEGGFDLAAQKTDPAELKTLLRELFECRGRRPMRAPTAAQLEAWMMHVGDDPQLLQALAEAWAGKGRSALAREMILSVAPEQRTGRGWMVLAQTIHDQIDLNQPIDAAGLESTRQSLDAWLEAFDKGVPELPYMNLSAAKLHARLGQTDEAVRRSEQALAGILQSEHRSNLPPSHTAHMLFHAAEVQVALDQPELAAAYMDQAESLVADDPQQLEQLAGRRQWVEVHLPVFLGKSQD